MNWSLMVRHFSSVGWSIHRGRMIGRDLSIASLANFLKSGLTNSSLVLLSFLSSSLVNWSWKWAGGVRKWS